MTRRRLGDADQHGRAVADRERRHEQAQAAVRRARRRDDRDQDEVGGQDEQVAQGRPLVGRPQQADEQPGIPACQKRHEEPRAKARQASCRGVQDDTGQHEGHQQQSEREDLGVSGEGRRGPHDGRQREPDHDPVRDASQAQPGQGAPQRDPERHHEQDEQEQGPDARSPMQLAGDEQGDEDADADQGGQRRPARPRRRQAQAGRQVVACGAAAAARVSHGAPRPSR